MDCTGPDSNTCGRRWVFHLQLFAGKPITLSMLSLAFLHLFRFYILPYLGSPTHASKGRPLWLSCMKDDFTPVELGWDSGKGEDGPIIRLSVEPMGPAAGLPSDPCNEGAANQHMHRLSHILPGMDLSWYNHLYAQLLPHRDNFGTT